jgi:hypothetical protein
MISTSILLILGGVLLAIFIGRMCEYILQKFHNRHHNEIAESNQ